MSAPKRLFFSAVSAALILAYPLSQVFAFDEDENEPAVEVVTKEQGCTFKADPDEFLQGQTRARREAYERAAKFGKLGRLAAAASEAVLAVDAASVPRRSFVDEEIFNKLQKLNVPAAPRSTDEEFVRRIHLDLIGRIPSSDDVRSFVADSSHNKRELLIDKLLYSREFSDKWSVWFADLIGMTEQPSTNRRPRIEGRNSFDRWLRGSFNNLVPIKDIVAQTITGKGNNYFMENGPANFILLGSSPSGPAQDTYDLLLSKTNTAYLGMAHYDCLMCHDGRRHLDMISSWGGRATRLQAQKLAAFYARTRLQNGAPAGAVQYEHPLFDSTNIADATAGTYDLNTNYGNRTARVPVGSERNLAPEYRDGFKPANNVIWREALAQKVINDRMFARNFANRIWKALFNLGLVDPVDTLDPDRLDPSKPPSGQWALQATHPELLEKLADYFTDGNTDIRHFIRLLVESSAYQMSSHYGADWKIEYAPLFARHFPRRLDAEEIHDAVTQATGFVNRYTWAVQNGNTVARGSALPQSDTIVNWAMQLPDINEPRANTSNASGFMNVFGRGNRDTQPRNSSPSILQRLSIMNDQFVNNRVRVTASPNLQRIARLGSDAEIIDELFLTFLTRLPSAGEKEKASAFLVKARTPAEKNTALEDLAWTMINKVDFLFSY